MTILLLFGTIGMCANADEIEDIYDASGADALYDTLPEEVQEALGAFGVTSADDEALLSLSFEAIVGTIWDNVSGNVSAPIRLFSVGVGLALLCVLLSQLGDAFHGKTYDSLFDAASVLFASAVVLPASLSLFTTIATGLEKTGRFLLAFVPVYGAVLTASGQPIRAALSDSALGILAQMILTVTSTVLVPLLTVYLALCVAASLCPMIRMDGIAEAAKRVVTGLTGVLMTVFTAVLTIKGTLAQQSDGAAQRVIKFAAGALFPVVGGAVSEAVSSVQGSMQLVKGSIGGFALLALLFLLLPPIVSLLLHQAALQMAAAVARILQADKLAALYKSAAAALSFLSGLMAICGVLLFITIGVLMQMTGG